MVVAGGVRHLPVKPGKPQSGTLLGRAKRVLAIAPGTPDARQFRPDLIVCRYAGQLSGELSKSWCDRLAVGPLWPWYFEPNSGDP